MGRRARKATRKQTRRHNSRLVLKTIYDRGQISRADIARLTQLTRTTVSSVVAGLVEQVCRFLRNLYAVADARRLHASCRIHCISK